MELWTLSAEKLLEASDVGVVVWAILAHFEGPPEILLQRCRERIDREGGKHRESLLAVAGVLARLHFDRPEWLDILGGSKVMIESPFIQEIGAEFERARQVKDIGECLEARFQTLTPTISAGLEQVKEEAKLTKLLRKAATCLDLEAFEKALLDELPKPRPASTRGKRRSRKTEE